MVPQQGDISSFAVERVRRIGSYVEQSVSGTGLHVILKAHPLAGGIAYNGIELYTGGRFFAMTGHAPDKSSIIAAPQAFAALADELRAQSKSSRKGKSDCSPDQRTHSMAVEANVWFPKLPSDKQNEVVNSPPCTSPKTQKCLN